MEISKLTFDDEFIIDEKQSNYIDKIISGKEFIIDDLFGVVVALKFVIRNYSFLENSNSIKNILDRIFEMDLKLSFKEEICLSIIDSLKIRKKRIGKDDKKERSSISTLIKSLEIHLLVYDNSFVVEEQKYDYAVMDYCINNEVPYYLLKRIISLKPEIIYLQNGDESILVSVLEKYINSQKIELRGHKHDYIDKEYYRRFYCLIMEYAKEPFSKDIQEKVVKKVLDFKEYLNKSGYRQEDKSQALLLFEEMISGRAVSLVYSFDLDIDEISRNLRNLTSYLVDSNNRVILNYEYLESKRSLISNYQEEFYQKYGVYPSESLLCQELGISKTLFMNAIYGCSTVSFLEKHVSYSLLQDGKGSNYLRMNVFDLSSYVKEGDLLDRYLLENVSKKFKNSVRYKKEKPVVSLTYQVKIFPDGKVGDLKIYPSVVSVQEEYSSLDNYREDRVLKSYVATYKKLTGIEKVSSIKEMEVFFKSFITDEVLKQCISVGIPVILQGSERVDDNVLMHIKSDLSTVFSKMSKEQLSFYLNVLKDNFGDEHYSNSNFGSGCYGLRLGGASSYVDLFNQRLLAIYDRLLCYNVILENFKEKSDEVVRDANSCIGYVGEKLVKNKKKVRKFK